ncbi:hypothetical protein BM1_05164 [Bipolaris maydis]|nr:hypothetical protein BM1_05164 [Bipolaris maydis]
MADSIFKVPKLKGSSNYDMWAIRIQSILIQQDCGDIAVIGDLTPEERPESFKNNETKGNSGTFLPAIGKGEVPITFNSTGQSVVLKDVLFVPKFGFNLLSLYQAAQKGAKFKFSKDYSLITQSGQVLAKGYYNRKVAIFYTTSDIHQNDQIHVKNSILPTKQPMPSDLSSDDAQPSDQLKPTEQPNPSNHRIKLSHQTNPSNQSIKLIHQTNPLKPIHRTNLLKQSNPSDQSNLSA